MEDITKHVIKISKTVREAGNSFSKKLKEIILEIFIIVFAATLAQLLERQREQRVREKEVKEFLLGLKNDLASDIRQAKAEMQTFDGFRSTYSYLSNISALKRPDPDSLKSNVNEIYNNTSFVPNASRFDGFESSGKLEEIDDKPLLQSILYFYEQAIPQLHTSESSWIALQSALATFIIENKIDYDDGSNNYSQLMEMPKARNLCKLLVPWPQLYERCDKIITLGDTIVNEINLDYVQNR